MARVSLKSKGGASEENSTPPVIVRPSLLEKEGKKGVVAKGVLEKIEPNKFNAEKNDFFLRDGSTLYIVNSTAVLDDQISSDLIGRTLEIEYAGKVKTKSGRGMHSFEVFDITE